MDDDDHARRYFLRALTGPKLRVDSAASGVEARKLIESRTYDAILSDVSMTEVDGIELLKIVHQRDPDLPVVLVTGAPQVESAIDAVDHGAFRYLLKPVRAQELRRVVAKALQLRELARFRSEAVALLGERRRMQFHEMDLSERFDQALQELYLLYQPIVRAGTGEIFAHEALIRSHCRELSAPGPLLDAAERLGQIWKLGRRIRTHVAADMLLLPEDRLVFVNLHPEELMDAELYHPDAPLSRVAHRVTLEITERARLENIGDLEGRVERLRHLGFRLALDDLGSGYAGLSSIVSLEPAFVKVDMALVRDVGTKPKAQKLIQSILDLGREIGLSVILEGVETAAEAERLVSMGADLLQGYYFARPAPFGHPGPFTRTRALGTSRGAASPS